MAKTKTKASANPVPVLTDRQQDVLKLIDQGKPLPPYNSTYEAVEQIVALKLATRRGPHTFTITRAGKAARKRDIEADGLVPPHGTRFWKFVTFYGTHAEARAAVAKLRGSPLVHRWERDGVDLVVYAKDSLSKIPGFTWGHHVQS